MKIKILIIFIINLLFLAGGLKPVFALEYTQKDGLFHMDVPAQWRWVESPQEVIITYPDGKTIAIDIQMVPSRTLSPADVKKTLKEADDRMIKEGIQAHQGTLIDDKEINLDGVYARRLDFKTSPVDPIYVTNISFFYKSHVFTIVYASTDDKIHAVMDDVIATFKFSKS